MTVAVELLPFAPDCDFELAFDAKGRILSATNTSQPWAFGVNIDATMLLDTDAAGIVRGIELLIPVRTSVDTGLAELAQDRPRREWRCLAMTPEALRQQD